MADRHSHGAGVDRRHVLRTAGRVGAAAAVGGLALRGGWLAAAPASATPLVAERPLRIGYLPITDASALLAAHELGYLRASGLGDAAPVLFRSWDTLAQALTVGDVDAVHLLLPFALQLRVARKVPLKVVAWGHTNGSTLTVAPTITATEQLAGRRVAVPYWWSIHSVLTQRVLASVGLTPVIREAASTARGTVELVVMAPADMVSALASGAIAGFTVADPFSAVAEAKGVGRVHRFLGDVWADHACCAITVRQELVDTQPRAVQALTDAVVAAHGWLDGNRGDAGRLLTGAGYLPQAEAAVGKVFTRDAAAYAPIARHPEWRGEHLGFTAFPQESYTAALVGLLRRTAVDGDSTWLPADASAAHRDLVDDRFVRASLLRAGQTITPRKELIEP